MNTSFLNTGFLDYINWIAVLCGALGFFILGALWYSNLLFAPKWIRYTKIDITNPDAKKGVAAIMFASFILMFISSVGIAIIRSRLDISGWMSGVKLGLLFGLCFGAAAISISYLYEKRPMGLHLINGGYTILGNIISGIIICSWA